MLSRKGVTTSYGGKTLALTFVNLAYILYTNKIKELFMDQIVFPYEVTDRLRVYGERIRLARTRRRWSQAELAERMGIERRTVCRLEQGNAGVSLGAFLGALWILGLWETAQAVADPAADPVGIFMEQQRAPARVRRSKDKELDF